MIAVHRCERLLDEKTGNNNIFLRMKPSAFFSLFRRQLQGWKTQCQYIQRKPVCLQTGSLLRTFSQRAGS